MDRYRLIAGIVICFVYLLAMFPVQTIIIGVVLAIAYFVLTRMNPGRVGEVSARNNGREVRRREALNNAKLYIAPYSDIWRNLKLSNKFCSLRLQSNGYTIVGRESESPYRTFRIVHSNVHSEADLWDMFCNVFDYNTHFDKLIELCRVFRADIKIEGEENKLSQGGIYSTTINNAETSTTVRIDPLPQGKQESQKEKLDVNNASEVELTALPGISIVMAKKIIKRREEIGGFKDINDVLTFTQLKPHMRMQLRDLICVNKMKGTANIKRHKERSIDL